MPTHPLHTNLNLTKTMPGLCAVIYAPENITDRQSKSTNGHSNMIPGLSKMATDYQKIVSGGSKMTAAHEKMIHDGSKMTNGHQKIIPGQLGTKKSSILRIEQQLRRMYQINCITKHFKMKNQTIDSKLLFAQNAIANALNTPEVASALSVFGYDETRLKEGEALYQTASDLQAKQMKEYGDQYAATDALNLAKAKANKEYMVHLKIARVALRGDRGAAESLQMSGSRKESLSGWLKQAKAFYENTMGSADYIKSLSKFGINKKKLEGVQKLVSDVETKLNEQLKEKGEAQAATQKRDDAFDALQEWMSDFIVIARISLETEPQYLEVLGIVEVG